ncbi:hypothetical protein GPZ77_07170 [Streptomyces sp. QHH-9511]|uniref:DUF6299 family protein n=1 Tax=Streptomyces sp. QHH-9511 TaxID=2684468 RepID=UPI0013179D7D|nr:DUF6299 family protein [Streptomyces sp. QHH-9511]QGZ48196.1 hypothetical protein GPZ77_07170 [Streptomyces sp. QHH-9511]
MRVRLAVLAVGTLLAAATAPLAHADAGNGLSVSAYGTLDTDGTVTVSGTYRCLDDTAGPVFVGSTLVQGDRSAGIGGTRAVCDGLVRAWTNSAVVKEPVYRAGRARVRATLMQLIPSGPLGLPLPGFLAAEDVDVTLR